MAEEMRKVKCPYCGYTFEVPALAEIAVCPACGSLLWIRTGEKVREHYMFPVRFEYNRAFKNAVGVAERQYLAPPDLAEQSSPEAGRLHYVPLYLFNIRVVADCASKKEAGLVDYYKVYAATSDLPYGLTETYKFAIHSRRYYDPRLAKRGVFHQITKDPYNLPDKDVEEARKKALSEARLECSSPQVRNETRWEGVVYYPFWEIKYKYGGRSYRALVDAVDGATVYAEYPTDPKKGAQLRSFGLIYLGIVGGLGLLFSLGSTADPGYIGLLTLASAIPGTSYYFSKANRAFHIFRLKTRLGRRKTTMREILGLGKTGKEHK